MITLFLDYKIKVLTSFANKRELNIFSSSVDIIMSFYLARSQSDSSSSENNEIIPTDPLLSKSPTCIIQKDLFEFLMRKSSNSA